MNSIQRPIKLLVAFPLSIGLFIVLALITRGMQADQQATALAPGDRIVVTCETGLTGSIGGNEAVLECAQAAEPQPAPYPSYPAPYPSYPAPYPSDGGAYPPPVAPTEAPHVEQPPVGNPYPAPPVAYPPPATEVPPVVEPPAQPPDVPPVEQPPVGNPYPAPPVAYPPPAAPTEAPPVEQPPVVEPPEAPPVAYPPSIIDPPVIDPPIVEQPAVDAVPPGSQPVTEPYPVLELAPAPPTSDRDDG